MNRKMKDIQGFSEYLAGAIGERLEEKDHRKLDVRPGEVIKTNDQKLHCLNITSDEEQAAPVVYIDTLFERYEEGESIDELADEAYYVTLDILEAELPPDVLDMYEDVGRENLSIHVLGTERNREYLKTHMHRDLGNGFAAVCDIRVSDGMGGAWRTTLTYDNMDMVGDDEDEVMEYAMSNSAYIDPPVMFSIEKMVKMMETNRYSGMAGIHVSPGTSCYILTNKSKWYGASSLFYPGMAKEIAEKIGEGYYALPVSLSEFYIIPESKDRAGIKKLSRTLYEANRSVVDSDEVLSDRVLYYSMKDSELKTVAMHAPGN